MLPQDVQESTFTDDDKGWYLRMVMELTKARERLARWHERCEKITRKYTDDREAEKDSDTDKRLNLFHSTKKMQRAMLYGKTPQVSVERRFADSKDAVARVAGEYLERLLNTDIQRDSDSFNAAMNYVTSDFLLYDFGNARLHYVCDFDEPQKKLDEDDSDNPDNYQDDAQPVEKPAIMGPDGQELAPAVPAVPKKQREDVETEYVHWKDQLWSPARVFEEVRLWFFRAQLSREELKERWPEKAGDIPLNSKRTGQTSDTDAQKHDPWQRADVWEVWDKEHKCIRYFVEGYPEILETKEDPLKLEGFWPFPRPLGFENSTTSELVPVPDYALSQDLYEEADTLTTRIQRISNALKVAGLYDKAATSAVEKLVKAGQNEMIAVEAWAALAEKGGIKGVVEWLPLEMIVAALDKLREMRSEVIQLLLQVEGSSDIMRGQQTENGTPGEAQAKVRFASVLMQAKQDEIARYASDMQRLKAEIISKHFDVATILERSNAQFSWDASQPPQQGATDAAMPPGLPQGPPPVPVPMQAAQLIKERFPSYRVTVKSESISMSDFAEKKAERLELLESLTTYMQAAAPLAQQMPGSMTFLLQLMQWFVSGFKGAQTCEGIIDQAITQAQQAAAQAAANPQPPQQDPKLQTQMAKNQGELQKIQAETQSEMARQQAETEQLRVREMTSAQINVQEEAQKALIRHQGNVASAALKPPQQGPGGGSGL